jgi:hypothetical protein
MNNNLHHNLCDVSSLCSAEELARKFPHALTENTIKNLAKNREYNGLSDASAVFRVGRSLKFSPERFADWLLKKRAV